MIKSMTVLSIATLYFKVRLMKAKKLPPMILININMLVFNKLFDMIDSITISDKFGLKL